MQKRFSIRRRLSAWDVVHNSAPFRSCKVKREAIRVALTLARLQRRLGDDSEISLYDESGVLRARRVIRASPLPA